MEEIQATRFRLLNKLLEPYFESGRLVLLHCNYGYLCFSSDKLHLRYKNQGNGQWQNLMDMFYFSISFDAEDKDTLKEKGIDIELWCYAPSEIRADYASKLAGKCGLGSIYSKKGFDLMYKKEIIPLKEKKADYDVNTEKLRITLLNFLENELPGIEEALLNA